MGRNLPAENNAALSWLEGHIDTWQNDPASIGLTQTRADDLANQIVASRTARTAATNARSIAIASTNNYNATADAMRAGAGDAIAAIKAFAENSQTPGTVYVAAGLVPKGPRTPAPAPSAPTITSCVMRAVGDVAITFDATGPTGTVYTVSRRLDSEDAFGLLGFAHGNDKSFTDKALPAGSRSATYIVRGIRGQRKGPNSPPVTLSLGNPASTQRQPIEAAA